MTHRMDTSRSILAFGLFLVLLLGARGQDNPAAKKPTTLEKLIAEKLIALHLPHTSGPVPVYYSPGFEARVLKHQKTLIACPQWYDNTCNFNGPGDLSNTDPRLGPLQDNGGPTQTMALLPGSPAIDAGNPHGCRDDSRHLLKTDQRGKPRPDKEDTGGCDIGAYERQPD
jgi:hypothetical protein